MFSQWFDYIFQVASGAWVVICLFEGTRRIRRYGLHKDAVILVSCGVLFCLAYSGFAFWKHATIKELTQTMQHNKLENEMPVDWGKDMEKKERECISVSLARMAFVETGKFHFVFDKNGNRNRFTPSEEDVKNRDTTVETRTQLNDAIDRTLNEALAWLIWGLTSSILGFVFSYHNKTK